MCAPANKLKGDALHEHKAFVATRWDYKKSAAMTSWAVMGELPKHFKESQGLPQTASARDYMNYSQLGIVAEIDTHMKEWVCENPDADRGAIEAHHREVAQAFHHSFALTNSFKRHLTPDEGRKRKREDRMLKRLIEQGATTVPESLLPDQVMRKRPKPARAMDNGSNTANTINYYFGDDK